MQRRRFLQMMAAGMIVSSCGNDADEAQSDTPPAQLKGATASAIDVIVIGAGIAGLAAAKDIQAAGKRVQLLEARQRVGGRIWSWREWGEPIELGANWIETSKGNPLVNLAQQANMETTSDPEEDGDELLIDLTTNKKMTGSAVENMYDRYETIIDDAVDTADDYSKDVSLRTAITNMNAYKKLSAAEKRQLEIVMAQVIDDDAAIEADKLSLKAYDAGDGAYSGGNKFVVGGYDNIPKLLAENLTIEYGVVVNKITWGTNGVTVTAGAKSWSARAVIVTIPLGVLKAGKVTFSPALPAKYTQAINQMAMGVLDRCILRFPTAFWGSDYSTFTLAGSDPHAWYQFIPLNEPLGIPALMAFNAGSRAFALEAKSDAQIVAEMTQVVQKAFGTKATSTAAMVTRWGKDPFALGAYSYVPLGGAFSARSTMATPVSNQLYFAGEAYTTVDSSTVHGAYNSGKKTAATLLSRLG